MKSAGWRASSIALRSAGMRLATPVEVSLCTTITALIAWLRSAVRRASSAAGSTPWRQSPGTKSTSSPCRLAMTCHRLAKWPVSNASTRSPGDSVLRIAASHAPVPDEG